jgi:hypothetical protein
MLKSFLLSKVDKYEIGIDKQHAAAIIGMGHESKQFLLMHKIIRHQLK